MPGPSNARQATSDHQEGLPRLACHCDAGYRKWIYFARSLKRRQNGRNHTTTWPSRPEYIGLRLRRNRGGLTVPRGGRPSGPGRVKKKTVR